MLIVILTFLLGGLPMVLAGAWFIKSYDWVGWKITGAALIFVGCAPIWFGLLVVAMSFYVDWWTG